MGSIRTVSEDEVAQADPECGASVGRFVVLGALGRGGMGVVLSAYDPELDRKVALKVLNGRQSRGSWMESRLREAQAMARLSHPNVVAVHEAGLIEGISYIVMEHVAGSTLRAWLTERARSWQEVLSVLIPAGLGLAAAHRAGVIHRDFKPENVLVGDDGRPRVLDFGLASWSGETGAVGGTRGYMAPEQLAGAAADERSDQYAFCVTLREALHGVHPEHGARSVRGDRPVPRFVERAVTRGLATEREDRWSSMDALLSALQPQRSRRGRVALALVPVVCAALAIGAAWRATRRDGSGRAFHLVTLTRRGVRNAQIFDGTKLAFVAGESLVTRGTDPDAEERVAARAVASGSLACSLDEQHLVVTTTPERETEIQAEGVDVDRGPLYRLQICRALSSP